MEANERIAEDLVHKFSELQTIMFIRRMFCVLSAELFISFLFVVGAVIKPKHLDQCFHLNDHNPCVNHFAKGLVHNNGVRIPFYLTYILCCLLLFYSKDVRKTKGLNYAILVLFSVTQGGVFVDLLAFMPAATLLATVGIVMNSIFGLTIGSFFIKKKSNTFILFGLGFGCGTILQLILCYSMVLSGFKPAGLWILSSVSGVFFFTLIVTIGVF